MRSLHFIAIIVLVVAFVSIEAANNVQSSLRKNLFSNYDRLAKPDGQVEMKVGLNIYSLGYCPVKEIMYTELWFDQSWNDSRLAWNPDDWDSIKMLRLPVGELWKPDISLYNGKMDLVQNSVYDKMTRAVINPDGKVNHVPVVKISSHCPKPEGESWPTELNCTLKLGSWTYDVAEMNPNFDGEEGDAVSFKYMTNKKVEILEKGILRDEKEYPCCPGQKLAWLKFWFRFKQEMGKWGGSNGGYGGWGKKGHRGMRPAYSSDEAENEIEED